MESGAVYLPVTPVVKTETEYPLMAVGAGWDEAGSTRVDSKSIIEGTKRIFMGKPPVRSWMGGKFAEWMQVWVSRRAVSG
jgi:hypothetical protein